VSLQQSIRIASPVRVAIVRTRVSEVLSGASQVGRIMSSIGGASPPLRGGEFSFFPFWARYKTGAGGGGGFVGCSTGGRQGQQVVVGVGGTIRGPLTGLFVTHATHI
jgi:hypothetical protein